MVGRLIQHPAIHVQERAMPFAMIENAATGAASAHCQYAEPV
jgi:hypothetical protein